ncbi:MAG: hypothetical protein ACTH9Q_16240, partial [Brevibacterium aurantiacum]
QGSPFRGFTVSIIPGANHFHRIGATNIHLSITHDANLTMTFVIVEGEGPSLSPGVDWDADHFG